MPQNKWCITVLPTTHHALDLARRARRRRQQLLRQPADLLADQVLATSAGPAGHGSFHAAHDVGAAFRLRIQRRAHRQHMAGLQVNQLRHDGGGAQVNRDAQSFPGREGEDRIVRENRRLPLRQLDLQIAFRLRPAGQPPALGQFRLGKLLLLLLGDRQGAGQHLDLATLAPPAAPARELDPMRKQHVLQGRAAFHPQHLAQRQQFQMDEIAHGAEMACDPFIFAGGKICLALPRFETIQRPILHSWSGPVLVRYRNR